MPPAATDAAPSDHELVRAAAAGDREAFAELYTRYHVCIFRFARLMTGSTASAEDVVQDVFLALMRDASRYDVRRASLSTYLYGIARRQTRRRLARERRFVMLGSFESGRSDHTASQPLDDVIRAGELERLRLAILGLPPRYREIVVLCDLQDVAYADAAAMLGCAIGTVRSRLHRARHLLAKEVQRLDGEPVPHRRIARCAI